MWLFFFFKFQKFTEYLDEQFLQNPALAKM